MTRWKLFMVTKKDLSTFVRTSRTKVNWGDPSAFNLKALKSMCFKHLILQCEV